MKNALIAMLLAALIGFGVASVVKPVTSQAAQTEDTYARIMRTRTLRCAHYIWPPFTDRNINTGKMEGVVPDYTEALAKRYGLKVEWSLELVPGNEVEQLKSGAADMICGGSVFNTALTQFMSFTQPFFYDPASAYVRADSKKIAANDSMNHREVVFTALEGDLSYDVAAQLFPAATMKSLPSSAQPGQMLEDLSTGKADAVVLESLTMQRLGPQYGLKLRIANPGAAPYLAVYPIGFGMMPGDTAALQLMTQMVDDMRNTGVEDKVLQPWSDKYPGGIIAVRDYATLRKSTVR